MIKKDHSKYTKRKQKDFQGKVNKKVKNKPVIKKMNPEKGQMRLNKYIANCGICSRRQADEYIKAGLIKIDGRTVKELGTKITGRENILYNGKPLINEKKVYILMNKPKDTVTTVKDEHARKTVLDLLKNTVVGRIYPVGRLDRDTTGVLLLTNDGELTKKLTHPSHEMKKIYHVHLNRKFMPSDFERLREGINLEDGPIRPDAVSYADATDKKQIGLEIHSGRNRIVRRIFDSLGYKVIKLDRVYFAGLTKKKLRRGKWRFLTQKEISMLKMNAYE